jgi:transketolase
VLRTVIAYPAPNKMNTGAAHGSALGADEVAAVKQALGFDPQQSFIVEPEVLEHARQVVARGQAAHARWQSSFDKWRQANPSGAALFDRLINRQLPAGWAEKLPTWQPDKKGIATRKASGEVLSAIGEVLPELWGGSADLGESNLTTIKGADSFGPEKISTKMWKAQPYGRTLHFGVREHAMGAILNGIVLHGPTRPYGGTFLIFSDYMRPAVRLAALMAAPTIYVWTHDSIGLGEDGPTHQPVEQLASLRAIPGLDVVRPADANETAAAWEALLEKGTRPTGLALTRQRRARRLRARRYRARGRRRSPRRAADRHGFRSAVRRRRPADAGRRGNQRSGGLDAVRGVVRRAGRSLLRPNPPSSGEGSGGRRGRHRNAVAALCGRSRRGDLAGALRCFR